jgi:anti-sigma B factor antagonist
MKVKQRAADGVVILDVAGELHEGATTPHLRVIAKQLADEGKLHLLLNFSKVSWVASTGLGMLVATMTTYEKAGGTLKICNLNKRVRTLFEVTRMHVMMQLYATEAEALAAFAD